MVFLPFRFALMYMRADAEAAFKKLTAAFEKLSDPLQQAAARAEAERVARKNVCKRADAHGADTQSSQGDSSKDNSQRAGSSKAPQWCREGEYVPQKAKRKGNGVPDSAKPKVIVTLASPTRSMYWDFRLQLVSRPFDCRGWKNRLFAQCNAAQQENGRALHRHALLLHEDCLRGVSGIENGVLGQVFASIPTQGKQQPLIIRPVCRNTISLRLRYGPREHARRSQNTPGCP